MTDPMFSPPVYSLAQAIERLGPTSRARYQDLRGLLADAEALQRSLMERMGEGEQEYRRIQHRLARAALPGGDQDEAKQLEADLAAAGAKLDKLEAERSKRNSVRANVEQVISRLDNFIGALYSGVPGAYGADPPRITVQPTLRDGETITAAILRLRGEINRTRSELARVRAAPLPAAEIRAALIERVERMAAEGQPRVVIEGTKVKLYFSDEQLYASPGQALVAPSGGASKLDCWLHRDQMIDRLDEIIERLTGPNAIPAGERPGLVRALEEHLFELEVEEEHWVAQAIAAGLECHRRVDASPWAILGWGLQPEAPRAEAAE
jgi:hypothetical protein